MPSISPTLSTRSPNGAPADAGVRCLVPQLKTCQLRPGEGRADDERAADTALAGDDIAAPATHAVRRWRAPVDERAVLVAQVDAARARAPPDRGEGTLGMQFHAAFHVCGRGETRTRDLRRVSPASAQQRPTRPPKRDCAGGGGETRTKQNFVRAVSLLCFGDNKHTVLATFRMLSPTSTTSSSVAATRYVCTQMPRLQIFRQFELYPRFRGIRTGLGNTRVRPVPLAVRVVPGVPRRRRRRRARSSIRGPPSAPQIHHSGEGATQQQPQKMLVVLRTQAARRAARDAAAASSA